MLFITELVIIVFIICISLVCMLCGLLIFVTKARNDKFKHEIEIREMHYRAKSMSSVDSNISHKNKNMMQNDADFDIVLKEDIVDNQDIPGDIPGAAFQNNLNEIN